MNLDFEIDKLTHSIENTVSGESFPTEVLPLSKPDLIQISKKNGWQFNWKNILMIRITRLERTK